jgi:hypothetical protein
MCCARDLLPSQQPCRSAWPSTPFNGQVDLPPPCTFFPHVDSQGDSHPVCSACQVLVRRVVLCNLVRHVGLQTGRGAADGRVVSLDADTSIQVLANP